METLASDSFSYSWLSNSKSPLDFLEDPHRESECQNFNFDTSISHSSVVLVHADEIFSNGILRPVFFEPSKVEFCNTITTPDPIQTKNNISSSSFSSRTREIHHDGFITRWRKSTWRTLVEFFRYFNPLLQKVKVGGSRRSTRVDTDWQVGKSLSSSSQKESPIGYLHHQDHENSIYEAVLHCKRSIGK